MNLEQWYSENKVRDEMLWKGSAEESFKDFYRVASELSSEYGKRCPIEVVSTHRSKSISLPVVRITTQYGVSVILRDNFHDIKMSLWSDKPLNHDLFGMIKSEEIHEVYCEGFNQEWVLPPFNKSASKFTASVQPDVLIEVCRTIRWLFADPGAIIKMSKYPCRTAHENETQRRAILLGIPAMFSVGSVSGTFRFFATDEPVIPNMNNLRRLLTEKMEEKYTKPGPLPYIRLDFGCGVPSYELEWLRAIDHVVGERRNDANVDRLGDHIGASVRICGLTEEQKQLAESNGCFEILKSDKD